MNEAQAIQAVLLTREQAAMVCGCSLRQWDRLAASQRTPAPVYLGRRRRWRRTELEAWAAAGLPDRRAWETLRREGRA